MTSKPKDSYEVGVFLLAPGGWALANRRTFADHRSALRWATSRANTVQRQNPLTRVRASIIEIADWPTLEIVLADYEKKRLAGDPEYNPWHAYGTVTRQGARPESTFTPRQGQFLAFIYYYTKLNGLPPAEIDFARYFRISPPSVHQMIVTLDEKRLIERTPGVARSIQLLLPPEQLPDLE